MQVICCFCGVVIADERTALAVVISAAAPRFEDPPSQSFYCHADHLGERLHPSIPFDPECFSES